MELIYGLKALASEEDGATVIEYALITSLISLAALTIMGTVGNSLSTMFNVIDGKLTTS